MTLEEFKQVCEAHQEESWWYLFLNYGDPLNGSNSEYAAKFKKMKDALEEYITFLESEQERLQPQDCEINL